jgi:hypothetical protein
MRTPLRVIAITAVLGASAAGLSVLAAEAGKPNSMMGNGGMMDHMGQKRGMMETCSRMMGMMGHGSEKPNDQWRKPAPSTPEKKS